MDWTPDKPNPGDLTKKMWVQYRAGRDALQQKFVDLTGESSAMYELGGTEIIIFKPGQKPVREKVQP